MNRKIIVVSFFPIYPVTFGSSVVISSFFENLPYRNKILYQISSKKNKIKNTNIKSIFSFSNYKFMKLFSVFILIKNIIFEIYSSKNKNIIFIEGASWIGYSFLLILALKIFSPNVKIIYKGHSIEYEIRKKNSNFFISGLSYIFEKFVYRNTFISTSVSNLEKEKIRRLYNVKTRLFPNVIKYNEHKIKKIEFSKKFIFYSGSYDYPPNKKAIDRLCLDIMPKLIKKNPNIMLVLTGSKKIPHKNKWLKNLGLVSKNRYINILNNSLCLLVPTNEGYGTRVKIIEALCHGTVVVSSKIGIEGIDYNKKNPPPFECSDDFSFIKVICKLNKKNNFKKKAVKKKLFYIKNYSAKQKTKSFIKEIDETIK